MSKITVFDVVSGHRAGAMILAKANIDSRKTLGVEYLTASSNQHHQELAITMRMTLQTTNQHVWRGDIESSLQLSQDAVRRYLI